jgi:heat shock protein HslJ
MNRSTIPWLGAVALALLLATGDAHARRAESEAMKSLNPLAGRSGSGKLNTIELRLSFGADMNVTGTTARDKRSFSAKYTISGNTVTFTLGPSTFTGTLSGKVLSGTRSRTDGVKDDWSITLD